jgi:hypothetical protein
VNIFVDSAKAKAVLARMPDGVSVTEHAIGRVQREARHGSIDGTR